MRSGRQLACAALAGAAFVAWPGQAAAKGTFTSVRVCGPSACMTIRDRAGRVALSRALGRAGPAFPRLGPYLRVTTRPANFDLRGFLVPGQGIVQLNGIDHRLGARASASIRRRVAAIAPYRPRISSAWVHGRRVARTGEVMSALRSAPVPEPRAVWSSHTVLVAVAIAGATPWSGWGSALDVPALRVLHSADGTWRRLTAAQARALAPAPARGGGGGDGVPLVPLVVAGGAALFAAGGLRIRGVHRPQASRS